MKTKTINIFIITFMLFSKIAFSEPQKLVSIEINKLYPTVDGCFTSYGWGYPTTTKVLTYELIFQLKDVSFNPVVKATYENENGGRTIENVTEKSYVTYVWTHADLYGNYRFHAHHHTCHGNSKVNVMLLPIVIFPPIPIPAIARFIQLNQGIMEVTLTVSMNDSDCNVKISQPKTCFGRFDLEGYTKPPTS